MSESNEYQVVQKSALKLKGVEEHTISKKKKHKKKAKKKAKEALEEELRPREADNVDQGASSSSSKSDVVDFYCKKTKSEIAFLKRKEERDMDRLRKKASVSHKERVEKFNTYLESLSEHYEPAKVSWTK